MKPVAFDYYRPDAVADAVALLGDLREEASVLAGGMTLGPMLNMRLVRPRAVIDVSRMEPLRSIAVKGDVVVTGACVVQAEAMRSDVIARELPLLASLARLAADQVTVATELPAPDKAVTVATAGVTVYVPLAGLVDLNAERNRLQKEIDNLAKQMERSQGLLGNKGFVDKAPPEVIDRERAKYEELSARRQQLTERLAAL